MCKELGNWELNHICCAHKCTHDLYVAPSFKAARSLILLSPARNSIGEIDSKVSMVDLIMKIEHTSLPISLTELV